MTPSPALRRIIRTARAERVLPSGWWIVPAVVGGAVGWAVLIWAVAT
jgi:hypothetical protein